MTYNEAMEFMNRWQGSRLGLERMTELMERMGHPEQKLSYATDSDGDTYLSEVVYTIDNTTKTRALFEINKGIGKIKGINVNSKIPKELRRVQFENMIYI